MASLMVQGSTPQQEAPSWLAMAGEVACHIGQTDFYEHLLRVFAALIPNQSSWIISYAPGVLPDTLYTTDVTSAAFLDYSNHFRCYDPFWHLCRQYSGLPVAALSTLDKSIKPHEYTSVFQKKCGFSDELALILPVFNNTCIMLFLQRMNHPFTQEEISRAQQVQPLLYGLHKAHVTRIFQGLSNVLPVADTDAPQGALVLDRHYNRLHSTSGWQRASAHHGPTLHRALHTLLRHEDAACSIEEQDFSLTLAALPQLCPLAPGGYLLTCAPQASSPSLTALPGLHITQREQDLLELLLQGRSTGEIAQLLGISKGTVKNHRQRLYRKAGVTSERGLVSHLQALLRTAPP
ncbi:helix-turn-helix transcriptional regulator [Acetobacter vaccinii]|nr:helix-turn-helix transcriptional regulator [Acetobacter vaccinii]